MVTIVVVICSVLVIQPASYVRMFALKPWEALCHCCSLLEETCRVLLSLQREMRHHVVRFLLETEQSYVQSLRTIIKVHQFPLYNILPLSFCPFLQITTSSSPSY